MAGKKGKSGSGGSGKRGAAVDRVFQGDRVRDEHDDRYESVVERSVEPLIGLVQTAVSAVVSEVAVDIRPSSRRWVVRIPSVTHLVTEFLMRELAR